MAEGRKDPVEVVRPVSYLCRLASLFLAVRIGNSIGPKLSDVCSVSIESKAQCGWK